MLKKVKYKNNIINSFWGVSRLVRIYLVTSFSTLLRLGTV